MNTTIINISIPDELKREADSAVKAGMFSSLNQLVHTAIRRVLPQKRSKRRLTVNGFTPEFERGTLEAAKEPLDQSRIWDGKGSFTKFVLKNSKKIHTK